MEDGFHGEVSELIKNTMERTVLAGKKGLGNYGTSCLHVADCLRKRTITEGGEGVNPHVCVKH